jgi:L-2-hydroxyglutarate oxidase LhgO
MAFDVDCVVIGAGVVGLAIARALARQGHEVVILEATEAIGTGVSSRNSEVIHAGIYFSADLWKTRLCVRGRRMLYGFCSEYGVPHRRCGKLIVANGPAEEEALRILLARGHANGVNDLQWLAGPEARAREPALRASAAVLSPSTGIIDSHGFMVALQGDAERHGAVVSLLSPALGGRVEHGRTLLNAGGAVPAELRCRHLINAAGLGAWALARSMSGFPAERIPPRYLGKGSYFSISGRPPFDQLIYPMPIQGGLGVHLTIDLAGRTRFGPNVKWVSEEDYSVDPSEADSFYAAIRTYWPTLPDGALQPDYAGIRPKIQGPTDAGRDFAILGPAEHGLPGQLHLFGVESPGLTAALAIAELVTQRMALGEPAMAVPGGR